MFWPHEAFWVMANCVKGTISNTDIGIDSFVLVPSRLERLEEDIISSKAGLVILDSVASVVRKEYDTTLPGNLTHRSNLLGQEAATLKYLAQAFHIPVSVCAGVKLGLI